LPKAISKLDSADPARHQFSYLYQNIGLLSDRDVARNQVAKFQKEWFDEVEAVPQPGRALALYQELSSAFVVGRQLPSLPKTALPNSPEKIREAGKVAEQLMLQCL
jgi:hypothetical protein